MLIDMVIYFIFAILIYHLMIMLLYLVADWIKPLQKFYCKIGWHCHSKDYQFDYSDGASAHCTCKWCGYHGMIDSQGNLF